MEALMVQFSQASGEFAEFSFGCIGHFNPFPGYRSSGYRKELRRGSHPYRESADLKYCEMLSSDR